MTGFHMRAETSLAEDFKTATGDQAAEVTRQFWEWYVRRPGAKMPKRPEAPPQP